MRRVENYPLWIGNAGDARNPAQVIGADIVAVVDLAVNEPYPNLPRDLVYLRFPLVDGSGNARWLLQAVVEAVAQLIREGVPTLVCCGAGLSRSPSVAAAALALVRSCKLDDALAEVCRGCASDVSPGFWAEIRAIYP
jgi:protein-tyrosine phosphatase